MEHLNAFDPTTTRSRVLLCFLWMAFGVSITVGWSQNLLDNPGFEQGTNYWTVDVPAILIVTNAAQSGLRAGFVGNRTAAVQGISQSVAGKLESTVAYFASCWVCVGSAYPQTVRLLLTEQGRGTNQLLEITERTVTTSNWVYICA